MTPMLIDYGLEASIPFYVNAINNVEKLAEKLKVMRLSIVFLNLLGFVKENLGSILRKIYELQEYLKNAKMKLRELKNVEEYVFHPAEIPTGTAVC